MQVSAGTVVYCPACSAGRCDSSRYLDYRPSLAELRQLYEQYPSGRHYHLRDFCPSVRNHPWPLPECRLNEWAALIDLRRARPLTAPFGPASPFGGLYETMDIGVEWFRNIVQMGYRLEHFPVQDFMEHLVGHPSLNDEDEFLNKERYALNLLEAHYRDRLGNDVPAFVATCYADERLRHRLTG